MRNTALLLTISFFTIIASAIFVSCNPVHSDKKKLPLEPVPDAVAKDEQFDGPLSSAIREVMLATEVWEGHEKEGGLHYQMKLEKSLGNEYLVTFTLPNNENYAVRDNVILDEINSYDSTITFSRKSGKHVFLYVGKILDNGRKITGHRYYLGENGPEIQKWITFSLTPVADAVAKDKDYSQWFLSNGLHHTHGLVAWYPFNGSAEDASGNENHGKVYGASLVKDRFEEDQAAYYFDGKEDWIDLKKCIIKRNLTLSLWCKLDLNQPHRGQNGAFVIYSAYWIRYGGLICFYHPKRMGGSIEFRFNGGVAHQNTNIWVDNPQGDISFNTWNNFVITHQNGNASAYCNSKLYSSLVFDNFSVPESYPPFTKNIGETIARGSWYDGVAHLKGTIDDIRIYNYALSNDQVVSLHELEK